MKHQALALLLCVGITQNSFTAITKRRPHQARYPRTTERKPSTLQDFTPQKLRGFIHKVAVDSRDIWKNIFTLQTMKTLTAVIPFYLIGRKADPAVHRQFYDAENHRNKNQPPDWLKTLLVDEVTGLPIILYGLSGWMHKDPAERRASQLFVAGLGWAWGTKIIVKQLKAESNLRPWNENYEQHKLTHGGNPSGHTTLTVYFATYMGLYKGAKYAVPLGLYSFLVASLSVVSNHHYLSQVVAGAGLGALFGVASYSVLEEKHLPKDLEIGLVADHKGRLGMQVAYNF